MDAAIPRAPAGPSRMALEAAESARTVADQLRLNAPIVEALGARLRDLAPRAVVTCARGSSDHAALFARYVIETRLGLLVSSAAPSVASLYHAPRRLEGVLHLAISQSGRSPDLLATVEAAKRAGGFVAAMVNAPDSPLEAAADATIPLRAGPEFSVAATKSYIGALAAILHLVAAWTEDAQLAADLAGLPARLPQAWALDWGAALPVLTDARSLYVIGRGPGLGVAAEAALKLKETCGLHAEAFSAAEVRHGPMAIVGEGFPILAFAQDDESRAGVCELCSELAARGARVMLAGGEVPGVLTLPSLDAPAALQPVLAAQSFYRLAERLARRRGFDPDRPPHLAKVTQTV